MKEVFEVKQVRLFSSALILGIFLAFWGVSPLDAAEETRRIVDMGGTEVVLPKDVNTVIDLWHANNQVVLLLGGADKLVGTTSIVKELPWFAQVYPRIGEIKPYAISSGSGNFNAVDRKSVV